MSAERFWNAVGHIDEDLVAEFVEEDMGKKPSSVRRGVKRFWWVPIPAVAAALALAVAFQYVVPFLLQDPFGIPTGEKLEEFLLTPWTPPELGEDVPVVEVSAEPQIPYEILHTGIPASWYSKPSGEGIDRLGHDLYYTEYLPIYGTTPQQAREQFEPFITRMLPMIRTLTTVTDTSYTITEVDNGYSIPGLYATVGGDAYSGDLYLKKNDYAQPQMLITAELLHTEHFQTVPKGLSEEETLQALSDTVDYLESVFGLRFNSKSIIDMTNTFVLQLLVIDEVRHDMPRELAVSASHMLAVYYRYNSASSRYVLYYLVYSDITDATEKSSIEPVGKARMLTISEAQELIAKGYVYGGHGCTICREKEPEISFEEYDKVTLTYMSQCAGEYGWYVPFYTFYKKSSAYSGQYYAVTVPAVELSGLEEYFAECTQDHMNAVNHETN